MGALPGFEQLQSPEVIADPYPWYAGLRAVAPVRQLDDDLWIAVGYLAVTAAVHDPMRLPSAEGGMGGLMTGRVGPNCVNARDAFGIDLCGLIAADPSDHTRLRRLLSRAFTPRAIAALEPRRRDVCDAMVDELIDAGPDGDLVGQVAYPFPVTVIAELLGIPAERRDDLKRWSDALVGALSGGFEPVSAHQSKLEMFGYLAEVVADRAARSTDDLIDRPAATSDEPEDGEPLTPIEIALFAILLLVAGNETTTNLIGLGASLARLEARVVAETLLRRTRSLEPTGAGTHVDGLILRGYMHLPVHARAN